MARPVITVLVPVLARPHRVMPLVESFVGTCRYIEMGLLFLCSPHDHDQIIVCNDAKIEYGISRVTVKEVGWPVGPGDYARKINLGAELARDSEFVFMAGDDLTFHPGWAERALATHLETGACVIGTNDLGNASTQVGQHSTHTLVLRTYMDCGTADDPDGGKLLHEEYSHNFCDSEFIATARARGAYAHCADSYVEHHHPFWGTAPVDATYARGQAGFGQDRILYEKRRHLWENNE
jgi:hypothetical protein